MTTSHPARVMVQKDFGDLLMLRSNVEPLFVRIRRLSEPRVVLDFHGVRFMSRSFADEYLSAKAASKKHIDERRVPKEVKRMMALVSAQRADPSSRSSRHRPMPRHATVVNF